MVDFIRTIVPGIWEDALTGAEGAGRVRTGLVNSDGVELGVNNPLPVDGDSVYPKDINVSLSDIGTFTDGSVDILDLFQDIPVQLEDNSSDSIKYFEFTLNRPIESTQLAMGCVSGTFSNVNILLKDLSGNVRGNGGDPLDPTARTTFEYALENSLDPHRSVKFGAVRIEFHTVDPVCIGFIFLQKDIRTVTRIQTTDQGGIVRNISGFTDANNETHLNVHTGDVHFVLINEHFHLHSGVADTLLSAASINDTSIFVNTPGDFSQFDFIQIEDGIVNENQFRRISQAPDLGTGELVLDGPLDNNYNVSSTAVEVVQLDFSEGSTGSIVSPDIFIVKPPADEVWHITRIMLSGTDNAQPDLSKFVGITGLDNGLAFRQKTNGVYRTLTIWRNNSDMVEDFFDVEFEQRAQGNNWGQRGRWTFSNTSVAIKLDGKTSDQLEFYRQDDLSALTELHIKAQGHVE